MDQYQLPPIPGTGGPGRTGLGDGATVVRRLQQSKLFREYREAFEATTGLPLVLRAAGSFQPPLQGSKRANAFCALMTQANATCAACLQLQQRVEVAATREAKTLECYAGLSESAVPVLVGDLVLGYLQTGQVFLTPPSRRRFKVLARTLPGAAGPAPSAWEAAYFQTRVVDKKQYGMVLRLLAVFAEHLGSVSNRLFLDRTRVETALITKTRAFIAEHHDGPLRMRDVASAVHVSPFHFCRVFKRETGQTFTGYLTRVRIERVKQLLLEADRRVSEAAYAAGFQSLCQFNRQFRRVTGEAPSRYRERLRGVRPALVRSGKPARLPDPDRPLKSFHQPPSAPIRVLCG